MSGEQPALTPAQLAELRDILERERARLQRSVDRARKDGPVQLDQQAVGRLSRMDALMNEGLAQGSMARAGQEIGLIDQALARMDEGTYGRCVGCNAGMDVDRLMAIPETLHCPACRV